MKGKSYEINIHICTYEKSEYRFSVKTGTSVIRSGIFLKIREWELQSMKALVRQLESHMTKVCSLRFFYSYQIQNSGKNLIFSRSKTTRS